MKTLSLQVNSIHTGNLILVNRQYPYRDNVSVSLAPVQDNKTSVLMERHAAVLLSNLMDSIQGWKHISAVSGWRSVSEQQLIWRQSLADSGIEFTEKYVAVPGHSEHQTGLAIDLGLRQTDIDFIRPDFPYKGVCQAFRKKASLFGFVERYPPEKTEITGIEHEPWHFRYVGMPHSAVMADKNLTLEEYIIFLRGFPYNKNYFEYRIGSLDIAISYLKAGELGDTEIEINPNLPYSISGNNVDGFIITEWRNKYVRGEKLRGA